jgi:RNA polymerase sigma factor (sigma-70 family)
MISPDEPKESLLNQNDVQLWEALQTGDRQAYATIYNDYVGKLYTYGKKLTSNTSTVEDAIQDVFTDLWRYKTNLGAIRSIKAYLFTCLRRQLIKNIHKEKVLVLNEQYLHDNFEFELSAQELLIQAQDKQAEMDKIKNALNLLTKRQKEIIYLRYFQDLTYQEINHMMGLNQRSTYNLVSKALCLLKEKLIIGLLFLVI